MEIFPQKANYAKTLSWAFLGYSRSRLVHIKEVQGMMQRRPHHLKEIFLPGTHYFDTLMGEAASTCLTKERFKIGVGKYLFPPPPHHLPQMRRQAGLEPKMSKTTLLLFLCAITFLLTLQNCTERAGGNYLACEQTVISSASLHSPLSAFLLLFSL